MALPQLTLSSSCFPSSLRQHRPTDRSFSCSPRLAALPSLDVEVLRVLSNQATGNGETTKQVVETATSVAGTFAIGALISVIILIIAPVVWGSKFVFGVADKFVETYKTNYPEDYERILEITKKEWEEDEELSEFSFEQANSFNFLLGYTILANGGEANTTQTLKESFLKSGFDDDELAAMCANAIVEQVKDLEVEPIE